MLRLHQPFIWNATNLTRKLRGQLIDLFQNYGAKTKIIYLEVPSVWEAPEVKWIIS